jgi:hypothetical protein
MVFFRIREINSKYFEDSEIYGIPIKAATIHDSDFVDRMQPIKLTKAFLNIFNALQLYTTT